MTDLTVQTDTALDVLLATRREGHGLPRAFYHDDALYAAEMRTIWQGGWLFAGFEFEIPKPGDFLTLDVAGSPLLVIRDDQRRVRAFHNVCRHRGSQLCRKESGHVRAIVCPYHSWTYSRQGELIACMGMHDGVDKSRLGLKPVHAGVAAGLVYVSLAASPPPFDGLRERFAAAAMPQGFDRAKGAHVIDYEVDANWKLVWENNRECFHCVQCHPQYVKANFDVYEEGYASEAVRQQLAAAVARTRTKWAAQGIAVTHPKGGLAPFPDPDRNMWYAADRTVMVDGFETESIDGRRVAPLMGDYRDADVGVLRLRSMPNFWVHGSCDHAVAARLLPAGPRKTIVRAYWLVDQGAREGDDYQLERLLPFWHLTNEQDWEICRWQQKGVDSIGYEPGPLSRRKEYNVDAFIRWYLGQMRAGADAEARRDR
jgi:Rieske 2Fe-2S family protein